MQLRCWQWKLNNVIRLVEATTKATSMSSVSQDEGIANFAGTLIIRLP
jgi:hypothetical protein